jgi:hypothetical protein
LGGNLKEAAGEAGERLQQSAANRGLSIDGVQEMAKEVGESFTNKMSSKPEEPKHSTPAAPTSSRLPAGNPTTRGNS